MREIEFRGFDLDLKKWVYGGYHKHIKRQVAPLGDKLKEEDIQHLIIISGFADWNMPRPLQIANKVDKDSIGQYTGLKDKNGTKIFEGDIFKWGSTLYQVIYADFGFKVKYAKGHNEAYLYDFQLNYFEENDEIEVIGNIYEDDDLLE